MALPRRAKDGGYRHRGPLVRSLVVGAATAAGAYAAVAAGFPRAPAWTQVAWALITSATAGGLAFAQARRHENGHSGGRRLVPMGAWGSAAPESELFQLPPDIPDFVGRRKAIDEVEAFLSRIGENHRSNVSLAVVTGQGGIGKTAFAIHVGHRLASRFPGGQLYVDLRGAQSQPLGAFDVLGSFLRALGVDASAIPETTAERSRDFRARISEKRILVLLDNAADEPQVRPLLPGRPGCAALITSRAKLAALEGARPVSLGVLAEEEALDLLGSIIGQERVDTDRAAAKEITRICGFLPLAVRIAGGRLVAKPHWSLTRLVQHIQDERTRISELKAGDLEVRSSFSLTYRQLSPDTARTFRLLGLVEAPDFPTWAVSALVSVPLEQADRLVEELVEHGLVEFKSEDPTGQSRYRFHDLLRAYSRECLAESERTTAKREAQTRLVLAYLHTLVQAIGHLRASAKRHQIYPRRHPELEVSSHFAPQVQAKDSVRWLEHERVSLRAITKDAFEAKLYSHVCYLAAELTVFYEDRSHWDDWQEVEELAVQAAHASSDRKSVALARWSLGRVYSYMGKWDDAQTNFEEALEYFKTVGDREMSAMVLCSIGKIYQLGQWSRALQYFLPALETFRELHDRHREAYVLANIADVYHLQGQVEQSLDAFDRCMSIFVQLGDEWWEANAGIWLGNLYRNEHQLENALARLNKSKETMALLGDTRRVAVTLVRLGDTHRDMRELEKAIKCLDEAVEVFQALGDRWWTARTLQSLGEAYQSLGMRDRALSCYQQSLPVLVELGHGHLSRRTQEKMEALLQSKGTKRKLSHRVWRWGSRF
jgi:tetratricopeptide (TPR) repeat protein